VGSNPAGHVCFIGFWNRYFFNAIVAVMTELPPEFTERLKRILSAEAYRLALESYARPRALSFRMNPLKAMLPNEREVLTESFGLKPVPWCQEAFVASRGTLRELQETEAYQRGALYVQELSSMVPALLLEPKPGETILDLTAAPGSKTSQMAAVMNNTGRILANDVSRARFFKMKANMENLGVRNVDYRVSKGENVGRKMSGVFDRVLLDAPCSGEGRFHLSDPESFSGWKLSKYKSLVPRQKMLFYSAWQALKPGGTLVYSTCTFAPEENEGILDWALEKFETMKILPVNQRMPNWTAGMTAWGKHTYDAQVENAVRILPDGVMEGFFSAKILKQPT